MDSDVEIADFRSKTGLVIVAVVAAVAIVAAGVVAWVLTREKPGNPIRVVVALRGEVDPVFDDYLLGAFIDGLTAFGFDAREAEGAPPPAGDDPVPALRQMARDAEAAHALLLDLAVERERDSFTTGTGLFRAELAFDLVPADPDESVSSDTMAFAFERSSGLEIASMVGDTWVELLLPEVVDRLYESSSTEPALAGDLSVEDLARSRNLRERRDAVEARRERVAYFWNYCATERERLLAQESSSDFDVQCVGDPCGQWTVVGVSQDGSEAFVQDISRRPIFPIPWERAAWAEPPESVLAIPLNEEPTPRPVFVTGNILGFAEVTPDGSLASIAAFSANQALAIVTLDLDSGDWRDVTVLDPAERAVRTLPAPDGSAVLLRMGQPRSGRPRSDSLWIAVHGLERSPQPWVGDAAWIRTANGELRVAGLLPGGQLGFARPDGTLEEPAADLPGNLEHILGTRNGALWMIWTNDDWTCELGRVGLDDRVAEPIAALPTCLDWPVLLPDGRLAGTAQATSERDAPGDDEVVLFDPERGTLTPLTAGPFDEEVLVASGDGSRLVFNRRLEPWPWDFDLGIYRRVVCWVDVPERD